MKKLPFIIIFDIDLTIIGNIDIVMKELVFLEYLYNVCKKKGINAKCPSMDLIDIQDVLKDGLLRPNVSDFINFCNKRFKNVEVFLYTNSGYSWTNDFIGKNLEQALKIKINRPFFTRENSMNLTMKKSLANIYPTIIRSLAKRYPSLNAGNGADTAEYVLNNRTIFIDDVRTIYLPILTDRSYALLIIIHHTMIYMRNVLLNTRLTRKYLMIRKS